MSNPIGWCVVYKGDRCCQTRYARPQREDAIFAYCYHEFRSGDDYKRAWRKEIREGCPIKCVRVNMETGEVI